MFKSLYTWEFQKHFVPPEVQKKRKHLVNITAVKLTVPERDGPLIARFPINPVCLVTGDGRTLPDDVKAFEDWGVPHDVYCVNRSLLYFQRPVDHWAAVDIEESVWFSQYYSRAVQGGGEVTRHTIGSQTFAFDVYWQMDYNFQNDFQARILTGNTGYFAVLTAIQMGYKKIVLAGMPLNMEAHWYEDEMEDGPNWNGWCYTQWLDFKSKVPEAAGVKSMGGYSAMILGQAEKDWTQC